MKCIRFVVLLLMVIGSLNWGLVGFFGYDLIADALGGKMSMGARVIFALVGLAGLWGIGLLCRCSSCCKCGPGCSCHSCHKKD